MGAAARLFPYPDGRSAASGHFILEGITVGTFLLCGVQFMGPHMDPVQCAVIRSPRVVYAVVDGALDTFVLFLVHGRSPPLFSGMVLVCHGPGKSCWKILESFKKI